MPFTTIPLPTIPKWTAKSKSGHSPQPTVDLTAVSDGFGIPSVDDPDPFGVLALEKAGLEIKEAGTHSRPTSDTFEFKPSPTSPVFRHSFQSIDGVPRQHSRRNSKRSNLSIDHGTQTANLPSPIEERPAPFSRTQTDDGIYDQFCDSPMSLEIVKNPASTEFEERITQINHSNALKLDLNHVDIQHVDYQRDTEANGSESPAVSPLSRDQGCQSHTVAGHAQLLPQEGHLDGEDDGQMEEEDDFQFDEHEIIIEEAGPAVQVVAKAVASPTATRAKIVLIPARAPPALPTRNPRRQRAAQHLQGDQAVPESSNAEYRDDSSGTYSPSSSTSAFDRSDAHSAKTWSEQTSLPDMESILQNSDGLLREDGLGPKDRDTDLGDASVVEVVPTTEISGDEDRTPVEKDLDASRRNNCNSLAQLAQKHTDPAVAVTSQRPRSHEEILPVKGSEELSRDPRPESLQERVETVLQLPQRLTVDFDEAVSIGSTYSEQSEDEKDAETFHSIPGSPSRHIQETAPVPSLNLNAAHSTAS